jgi:hypothetical protein
MAGDQWILYDPEFRAWVHLKNGRVFIDRDRAKAAVFSRAEAEACRARFGSKFLLLAVDHLA